MSCVMRTCSNPAIDIQFAHAAPRCTKHWMNIVHLFTVTWKDDLQSVETGIEILQLVKKYLNAHPEEALEL